MEQRSHQDRRLDNGTAERFDMAVRTALAFDQDAAYSYLSICGVERMLIRSFAERFPTRVRAVASLPWHTIDRRADSMQRAF
ncbi:hypothetical protein [Pseudoduganella violaceinigra]|uniref:hypothetical protein n=1 Tax=Pseudoduganella violaceinigra TaxID=246602 RepID=UPI00048191E9|nr:hypothetical protein [Pseudoduganella violaceinigra]